ncbi:MAG TPA: TlpA disulfide reductase family protein [Bryobacteraceae bacterium]|jgi:thiol-disulfide isomerase/thioredoxin|nr:TlpA disulfide reductase family protein [Bryobacteraceae bacterium]
MRTILVTILGAVLALTAFAVEVGKPSPALTIQRLSGPPLQLSQYKGKVVALALIDTNCPHCQNLTRLLSTISKEYSAKGVQVVGCAFNDGVKDLLAEFLKKFEPAFPVGYCDRDSVMVYVQYSVLKPFYVPHMVFLDRRGVVRGDFAGESDFMTQPEVNIRTELDQLLKAGTSTSAAAHKQ